MKNFKIYSVLEEMESVTTDNTGSNTVLPPVNSTVIPPKTMKSFIKLCEMISNIDRNEMKGIKTDEQYEMIGFIRAAVQNDLAELKRLL